MADATTSATSTTAPNEAKPRSWSIHDAVPIGSLSQCRLLRVRPRGARMHIDLHDESPAGLVNGTGDQLGGRALRAVKHKALPRTYYDIFSVAAPEKTLVARVIPNVKGTVYTIEAKSASPDPGASDTGSWTEIGAVMYDSRMLVPSGPRKMTVLVPAVDSSGTAVQCETCGRGLIARYDEGDPNVVALVNWHPKWDEESRSYKVAFSKRVRLASSKNFLLIHPDDEDYAVLQFGKVGVDSFTLDMRFPMSPVLAFAVGISSIDQKLGA